VLELADGRLWVGTRGNGVDVWDRASGRIDGFRPDAKDQRALSSGVVTSLAQMRDGTVWVGTADGLHRFDAASRRFDRFGGQSGLPDVYIRRLLVGIDATLWIGTDAGLARRSVGAAPIEALTTADGTPLRIDINALVQASDGRLWAGSSVGLFTVDPGTSRLRQLALHAPDSATPIAAGIVGLLLDRGGQLWADTPNGLHRVQQLDSANVNLVSVSARLGAVGVPFGANLLEDGAGRIWTQRFVYDPRDDSLYELGRADGADLGTPWFRAYTMTHDGLLLFGGSKGLMVVDPPRFRRWQYQPPLAITELKVGGVQLPLDAADQGFEVTPEQRGFSIEFAALDYTAPQRNRYQYRLDGFDRDWIDADASRRLVSYNSLSPGPYLLRIRGSGRAGAMSAQELAVAVTVLPAFWQSWWFKAMVLGLAAVALVAALRLHSLRIRKRALKLEQLVARRTAELTQAKVTAELAFTQLRSAQDELVAREKMASLGQLVAGVAHEINTPVGVALTASSYLSERSDALRRSLDSGSLQRSELVAFVAQTHEASTMIGQNLMRAAHLVKNFKQVSVDRSSDDRRRFDLHDNLRAVVSSLELTWKRRPVRLELDCAARIELDSYPGALGQVITNLIQNALLHAFDAERSGTMRISAAPVSGDRVRISFEDDGAGIDAAELTRVFEPFYTTRRSQGGSGLGLHIVYNLVTAKLGGRIEASGEPGRGMRFVITIPVTAP
jgi:signal transduction histidine kinase